MSAPPCTQNPDLWFTDAAEDIAAAKAICLTCPLLAECRQLADDLRPEYGVWAGASRDERPRGKQWSPASLRQSVTDADVRLAEQMCARGFTVTKAARHLNVPAKGLQKAMERARKRVAA